MGVEVFVFIIGLYVLCFDVIVLCVSCVVLEIVGLDGVF